MDSEEMVKLVKNAYRDGAEAVIQDVSNWLDEDTIDELKARYLNEEDQSLFQVIQQKDQTLV